MNSYTVIKQCQRKFAMFMKRPFMSRTRFPSLETGGCDTVATFTYLVVGKSPFWLDFSSVCFSKRAFHSCKGAHSRRICLSRTFFWFGAVVAADRFRRHIRLICLLNVDMLMTMKDRFIAPNSVQSRWLTNERLHASLLQARAGVLPRTGVVINGESLLGQLPQRHCRRFFKAPSRNHSVQQPHRRTASRRIHLIMQTERSGNPFAP